jgi:hypothetical protein
MATTQDSVKSEGLGKKKNTQSVDHKPPWAFGPNVKKRPTQFRGKSSTHSTLQVNAHNFTWSVFHSCQIMLSPGCVEAKWNWTQWPCFFPLDLWTFCGYIPGPWQTWYFYDQSPSAAGRRNSSGAEARVLHRQYGYTFMTGTKTAGVENKFLRSQREEGRDVNLIAPKLIHWWEDFFSLLLNAFLH